MADNLRVLASGGILVLDPFRARATGRRRYIGRDVVKAFDLKDLPPDAPYHHAHNEFLEPGQAMLAHEAFPAKAKPDEIPLQDSSNPSHMQHIAMIRKALRAGDLLPADKFTADFCGVPFKATKEGK